MENAPMDISLEHDPLRKLIRRGIRADDATVPSGRENPVGSSPDTGVSG
jgi:hypothetical protein